MSRQLNQQFYKAITVCIDCNVTLEDGIKVFKYLYPQWKNEAKDIKLMKRMSRLYLLTKTLTTILGGRRIHALKRERCLNCRNDLEHERGERVLCDECDQEIGQWRK